MKKSKEIAFLGLITALGAVCLLLGSIVGVLDISSAVIASLLLIVVFEELRWKSVMVYFATLVVSFCYTFFATPLPAMEYAIFALFPLLMPFFNKLPRVLGYVLKAIYAIVASGLVVVFMYLFVPSSVEKPYMFFVYLLLYVVIIVLFDLLIVRFRR